MGLSQQLAVLGDFSESHNLLSSPSASLPKYGSFQPADARLQAAV